MLYLYHDLDFFLFSFASSARVCIYMVLDSGMVIPLLHPSQANYLQICIAACYGHELYLTVAHSRLPTCKY
jgi:hypothetical protein